MLGPQALFIRNPMKEWAGWVALIFERKGCGFSPAHQAWAPVSELLILPWLGPRLCPLSVKKVLCNTKSPGLVSNV